MPTRIQIEPFDHGAEAQGFAAGRADIGAIVTFVGIVRSTPEASITAMEIEHYPGMTERAIDAIAQDAISRWSLADALVIHRYGRLTPGDAIMMVATAAPHRRAAFEAADFLMDYLKSRAPFWKKEIGPDGASWVASKAEDEADLTRWSPPGP